MKSRAVIAAHWYELAKIGRNDCYPEFMISLLSDPYEPFCWACGLWLSDWDRGELNFKRWDRTNLVRCHIKPKALGGSDHPDNIVLMCKMCHETAPDTIYPAWLFEWMNKRNWTKIILEEYQKACDQLGVDFLEFVYAAKNFVKARCGMEETFVHHFSDNKGAITKRTSIVAAVMEWTNGSK